MSEVSKLDILDFLDSLNKETKCRAMMSVIEILSDFYCSIQSVNELLREGLGEGLDRYEYEVTPEVRQKLLKFLEKEYGSQTA